MNKLWTKSEVGVLQEAYASPNGVDLVDLIARLGRSKASIACKADDLGFTSRRGKHIVTEQQRKIRSERQRRRFENPEERQRTSERLKAWHASHEHPRGFLGHHRTKEDLEKMNRGKVRAWKDPKSIYNSDEFRQMMSDNSSRSAGNRRSTTQYSRAASGHREDIGIFVRSAWEANYARYLNFLMAHGDVDRWEYESETFWFEKIRRGVRSYKPDFKVYFKDGRVEYHEVKGWMYPRAKTALHRMEIYYPDVKLVLIDEKRYKGIANSAAGLIPNWERPSKSKARK